MNKKILEQYVGKKMPQHRGFAVDTRKLAAGDIFFALSGAHTDGHHFLKEAASRGAALLVVRNDYTSEHDLSCPIIRVEDPLQCLQSLARDAIHELAATTFAITGSFGKTTTKEFLIQLLRPHKKVLSTAGTQNSQIGLPLTLLNSIQGDESVCVVEMGLTEKGHIQKLVEIAPPDMAMITSLAPMHIAQFGSMDDLVRAKLEIFSHPKTTLGLISQDCMEQPMLAAARPIMHAALRTFSLYSRSADWHAQIFPDTLLIREGVESVALPAITLAADHFYQNLLGAIAAARMIGLDWDQIGASMHHLELPARRFQEIIKQGIFFIDDAYNAGEDSTRCALQAVAKKAHKGRKIAVLGELAELGQFSEEIHRRLGLCALECVEDMICYGKGCYPMVEACKEKGKACAHFFDMDELIAYLRQYLNGGDLVLLKGSRGNRLERILEAF